MTSSFSDDQYELAYPDGIEHHWWNIARSSLIRDLVSKAGLDTSTLLEVGCGKGLEVRHLRHRGINVLGVELANVTPLKGMESYINTGMDALDLPLEQRQRITAILLLDVIEHLPEPEVTLKSIAHGFPNLEVVILTVPAGSEVWSNYDEFYGHYRRYSLQLLEDLASRLHWRQESTGYFFKLTYPIARLLVTLNMKRSVELLPPATQWRWLHRLIARFFRIEYHLLPRRLMGTSAFSVLRVNALPDE